MRESAAAWGAALNLIPSLGPVIEGYLKQSEEGRRLSKAIKDPHQQEFFIQAWQQSAVFKAFFPEEANGDNATEGEGSVAPKMALPAAAPPSLASHESPIARMEPALQYHVPTPSPSYDGGKMIPKTQQSETKPPPPLSLDDILAKDAARP